MRLSHVVECQNEANDQILNMTGFRKALKKFEKLTKVSQLVKQTARQGKN